MGAWAARGEQGKPVHAASRLAQSRACSVLPGRVLPGRGPAVSAPPALRMRLRESVGTSCKGQPGAHTPRWGGVAVGWGAGDAKLPGPRSLTSKVKRILIAVGFVVFVLFLFSAFEVQALKSWIKTPELLFTPRNL